ncbi:HdeD family acid-resistance protein [Rhodobacteraceae bacterium NNCM2]|nr:HdeD family acid-resistance protein [Coraliihabitans acroporae]
MTNEPMTIEAAAAAMREAVQATIKKHSLWYLVQAGLLVLAGFAALIYPLISTEAVVIFLGWTLIIVGVVQGISLIGAHRVSHFWLQLISVALSVLIGFLFLRDPTVGIGTLVLLMIIFFMMQGISKIVFSLTIRPFPNWGWVLVSGIISVLLSVYMLANPALSVLVLGILIGFQLIGEGVALGYMAWKARQS